jgi:hypothetical protein
MTTRQETQEQSDVNKNRAAPLDQNPDNFIETAVVYRAPADAWIRRA